MRADLPGQASLDAARRAHLRVTRVQRAAARALERLHARYGTGGHIDRDTLRSMILTSMTADDGDSRTVPAVPEFLKQRLAPEDQARIIARLRRRRRRDL